MMFAVTTNDKNFSVLVSFPVDVLDETMVKPALQRMNRLSTGDIAPPFLCMMGCDRRL